MVKPGRATTVAFALAAGLGLAVAQVVGSRILPGSEWAVISIFLLIVGIIHAIFFASWTRRTEKVIGALRAIAEGKGYVRKDNIAGVRVNTLGDRVRNALEDLGASVEELRREKCRTELVLANMADGIIVINLDYRVVVFNRAAGLLFDKKEPQIIGRKLEDLDFHPEVSRLASECLIDKKDTSTEIKLPGWPQRVISMRASPSRSISSEVDCAVIIIHDLSDIRRHEQNQREFTSNVSHELKTPITAIRTTAEALLSGAKNDERLVDSFLASIVSESERLSILIEDIMDLARMDSGVAEPKKHDVDITEAINRAVNIIQPQANQKNIDIKIDIEPGLTPYCDEIQIVHLISNLVDNAVKYTLEGGVVEIIGRETASELILEVKDTGMGIPHGELDRIFERFYRVDKARSRRMGGTGLGLSIVKEIVDSHGGSINVETELGKGSAFIVKLPLRDDTSETNNG